MLKSSGHNGLSLRFGERGDHGVDEVLGLGLRVAKGI
jgi:hypothetical protein